MHLPYVIVGHFNLTPEQLVATQWIDQIRGQIVLHMQLCPRAQMEDA